MIYFFIYKIAESSSHVIPSQTLCCCGVNIVGVTLGSALDYRAIAWLLYIVHLPVYRTVTVQSLFDDLMD